MSYKLFLSHSSKDEKVVKAFVSFMYKIGLTEKDIVCSSVPETKIAIGNVNAIKANFNVQKSYSFRYISFKAQVSIICNIICKISFFSKYNNAT